MIRRIADEERLVNPVFLKKVDFLRAELLEWFKENGRHKIPWKLKEDGTSPAPRETLCAYKIWVAEVMLQQTQLKKVEPYWEKWMKSFPALSDLAMAEEQEVLILWQGLGYYSRARRILDSSKILLEVIGLKCCLDPNAWPRQLETWMGLPGIGRTTAGSILSSAFDLPAPILDGNVKRVLTRLIASKKPLETNNHELWALSELLLDKQQPRNFNQALMDLGSKICTPINPQCCNCPWKVNCDSYSSGDQLRFPVKRKRKPLSFQVIGVGVVLNLSGEVLIDQRLEDGLLGGMWEFPGGKQEKGELIEETIFRELKEELGIEVEVGKKLTSMDHAYSHKKLHFIVHLCKWISGEPKPLASQQVRWVSPNNLSKYPFPAANAKMIDALFDYLNERN